MDQEWDTQQKKNREGQRERERNRQEALTSWERLNSHVMIATAGTVLAKLPPFGNSRVVNWTDDADGWQQISPTESSELRIPPFSRN